VQRAARVAADDPRDAGGEQDLADGDARRAEADDQHPQLLHAPSGQLGGVEQGGEHDDRGAVLVVVEDRDVELGLQPVLDLEAAGGGDVLEVDAAEGGGQCLDDGDDLVRVRGGEADRKGVDAPELLEQHRLALHDRHRRLWADVTQPEHGAAVGDHGHGVALDRVLEGAVAVLGDRLAHAGDAGRVGHREVVAGPERVLVALLDLAADVQQERAVGAVEHLGALDGVHRRGHLAQVLLARRVDRDVAQRVAVVEVDEVDRADRAPRRADRRGDVAQHPRAVRDAHAQDYGELSGGGARHP
jgi:hypothetical protein